MGINITVKGISPFIQQSLLGIYAADPDLLIERQEIAKLYAFYGGKAPLEGLILNDILKGQSWQKPANLDYTPSQDIRNHVKKILNKQARFMFGVAPDIQFKPIDKKNKDAAESKRTVMDAIFEDTDMWGRTSKAFLDCTIGKRVLMTIVANPGKPVRVKYYTMDEFTYMVDPADYTKLIQVIIAYIDESTITKPTDEQRWYRWKYYMQNNICMLQYGIYDGAANPIKENLLNTQLDEIPCRVIINGGLTGDVYGSSDVVELLDLQDAYNHTTSDFRDALRFRMFEQPVFVDADSESLKKIKIAPNAMIDLKSDPAFEQAHASASMLTSQFAFTEAVKSYLEGIRTDMYEIMDQPRPEQMKDVPSAKALKFLFYDLIARCEEKWREWDPALKWAIKFIIKCTIKWNLHPELDAAKWLATETNIILEHNYPIPEDEDEKKKIAIQEVAGLTRSHRSYIREFSNVEDEDGEWNEILEEQSASTSASADPFSKALTEEGGQGGNNSDQNPDGEGGAGGGTGGDNNKEVQK